MIIKAMQTKKKKNVMEHESDGDNNYNWGAWNDLRMISTGDGRVRKRRTNKDNPSDQIAEKSPGDLRRLAVAQNPVIDYQQSMM